MPLCSHTVESMQGAGPDSPVLQCAACAGEMREQEATQLLAHPLAYWSGPLATVGVTSSDTMLAPSGGWRVPVIPLTMDALSMTAAPHDAALTSTVVHVFVAHNNVRRTAVSGWNLLTNALQLWHYLIFYVSAWRMSNTYVCDSVRKADVLLVSVNASYAHEGRDALLAAPTAAGVIADPILGMLDAVQRATTTDAGVLRMTPNLSRSATLASFEEALLTFNAGTSYLTRFFAGRVTPHHGPFMSSVSGVCALKMYRITYDKAPSNVPRVLDADDVALMAVYAGMQYAHLRDDVTAVFRNMDPTQPEREVLAPFVVALHTYLSDCITFLNAFETTVRTRSSDLPPSTQALLSAVMGGGWDTNARSLTTRLRRAAETPFIAGQRVLRLTCVAAAVGTGGAGSRLIHAAKLMAARMGAHLLIESVTWPCLPFTFYFRHGFNFCGSAGVTSGPQQVHKWVSGTVFMVWSPPTVFVSPRQTEESWTTRELSLSNVDGSNGDLSPSGPSTRSFTSFIDRLSSLPAGLPYRLIHVDRARSPYGFTIHTLLFAALMAHRRGALKEFTVSFRVPRVTNMQLDHAREVSASMCALINLSPAEALAEKACLDLGVTTLLSRPWPGGGEGGGGGGASRKRARSEGEDEPEVTEL